MTQYLSAAAVAVLILAACQPVPEAPEPASARPPADARVMPDGPLGESVRRGLAILVSTRDSLPAHVGNDLKCTSCHLDFGTRPNAMPWTGVAATFPQYNSRAGRVFSIEDRINGCFERSMNGKAVPLDSPAMRDMVAYMVWLGSGSTVGRKVDGQGLPKPEALSGDLSTGADIWQQECSRCHGSNGEGSALGPPTWGPRSYNIGAGMARLRTAAGFIQHNMPFDKPGSLTEEQAVNVAAYLVSRDRPDFARKHLDWPRGGKPADAAY